MKTFNEYSLRELNLKNRIVMPPMCMYSSDDSGHVKDWHVTHYVTRAIGGVGLIIVEATAVTPNGRISSKDLGIWDDDQVPGLKSIVDSCKEHGTKVAIQLAHAGRKCSADGETTVAPTSYKFSETYKIPKELTKEEIEEIVNSFRDAAIRANDAGFDAIEIHGAHGYLIHEFLSPRSNMRQDEYGGNVENRTRFLQEILSAVKEVWPNEKPILLRISADDYLDNGLNIDEIVKIINIMRDHIDMVHVSSGGLENVSIKTYPGYQVRYSEIIREKCNIPTIAVGLINEYDQVEEILSNDRADLVALGRGLLRNPYWVLNKAYEKGYDIEYPKQYERGF
ncbi:NADPH dehydrogenase NamA [Proteiniborus sp. MB09-C3]|uniref:NADPH dehydrogenase NamA n=1 Tax=Proteiniborus sp. MB09-C3 TaxID=3050072 RepID=UPI002555DEA0|nr:NADPH dehydrogenase NamA [Proteiniborus sp. MB09-C3]WIV12995.1 NADPH dehydrogenase NamA [Proteiniborus sp. MB09-C3]